jgi:hypothetical protein
MTTLLNRGFGRTFIPIGKKQEAVGRTAKLQAKHLVAPAATELAPNRTGSGTRGAQHAEVAQEGTGRAGAGLSPMPTRKRLTQ